MTRVSFVSSGDRAGGVFRIRVCGPAVVGRLSE